MSVLAVRFETTCMIFVIAMDDHSSKVLELIDRLEVMQIRPTLDWDNRLADNGKPLIVRLTSTAGRSPARP